VNWLARLAIERSLQTTNTTASSQFLILKTVIYNATGMALNTVLMFTGCLSITDEMSFHRLKFLRQCSSVNNSDVQCAFSAFGHKDL